MRFSKIIFGGLVALLAFANPRFSDAGEYALNGSTNATFGPFTGPATGEVVRIPQYLLQATNGPGGQVSGDVNIWVDENRTGKVKALPDKYSSFGGWTGTTTSGEEDLNVVMKQPHNVTANFIPMLTSNGTPYAWLAGFGLTNGFEHEDGLDQDGDRAFTWQEHVADTCPTNSDDVFSMSVNRTAVDLHNTSTERIYGVKGRPNLSEGTWQEYIGGFTGNDGTVSVELNDGDNFYEGTVSKPSEE